MDFNKIDFSKYQVRFNQQEFNKLSIIKDNELKHVVTFHFIGMINLKKELFYWANIIPGVNKKFSEKNNKIKELKVKYQNFNNKNDEIYYQILSEDIISLNNIVTPDYLKTFFNILLENPIIILNNSNNNYQLISIENIVESY
ncbi:hypothetical protein crov334 [Cafeteria roenbergensis virus]|uniref:Uncharacterized protein n=1 Tax=Cafeteria roenbergensis virus (strain BV-PW1) TaxID=693272 RepID=E3T5A5_CROVB|nr:hypothetical protein crov334 [Cafeteria roenbergensis virus BV-PW1]ADO67368.1 hypothetical protein crov334 [Cafeteria roenbergensis virus BV-PW1]